MFGMARELVKDNRINIIIIKGLTIPKSSHIIFENNLAVPQE